MSYSVIVFRSFYYIKGQEGDPMPPNIGPYRYQTDALKQAEEFNEKLKTGLLTSDGIRL